MKYFGYPKCGTCRKALKWLKENDIELAKECDITEQPPSTTILKKALANGYTLKQLFNTSGVMYREMGLKDKVTDLTQAEALKLLSDNGRLVKRPIVVAGEKVTVGFKEGVFEETWGK